MFALIQRLAEQVDTALNDVLTILKSHSKRLKQQEENMRTVAETLTSIPALLVQLHERISVLEGKNDVS